MQSVCREISPGHLSDTIYVWDHLLLLIFLLCFILMTVLMFTPALAGAERQVCILECAVHSLDSALDVRHPAKVVGYYPNIACAKL